MRVGIVDPVDIRESWSSARQLVAIPAGVVSATLRLWLYPASGEPPVDLAYRSRPPLSDIEAASLTGTGDAQYVFILDENSQWLETLVSQQSNDQEWAFRQFDLMAYAGRTIKLHLGAYNDGGGGVTALYVDDVSLEMCAATTSP